MLKTNGSGITSCKNARLTGAHVLINLDSTVREAYQAGRQRVEITGRKPILEAIICSVGTHLSVTTVTESPLSSKLMTFSPSASWRRAFFVSSLNLIDCFVKVLCKNARLYVNGVTSFWRSSCSASSAPMPASTIDNCGLGRCNCRGATTVSPVLALKTRGPSMPGNGGTIGLNQ